MLAGYILMLIRCFPDQGDDIRMRLYLTDISPQTGRLPALKFFWLAMRRTTVFRSHPYRTRPGARLPAAEEVLQSLDDVERWISLGPGVASDSAISRALRLRPEAYRR